MIMVNVFTVKKLLNGEGRELPTILASVKMLPMTQKRDLRI